ncbi:MAG TPA: thioredoxin family protein, partial [Ruminiclostridium sp.]|nr:thioredoxin family protein [Ruminiclostridium sp.]
MNRFAFLFIIYLLAAFWAYSSNNISVNSKANLGEEWQQAVQEQKPILVYIYTDWCGTCKQMGPLIDSLAYEYSDRYTYIKANAEDSRSDELSKAFKVRGYPTIYLFNPKTNKSYKVPL